LSFEVIEFNKSAKKIILSHSRIHEDEKRQASGQPDKRSGAADTRKAAKKIKSNLEKTTLGDISDLAALKNEMEENEKNKAEKKK
ncbi:MAG: 30S ribosomal protein S1, partial [Bacteroidales bacterium]|nr:30S ribosomal protein S1 [Bacteroidales bacterium]